MKTKSLLFLALLGCCFFNTTFAQVVRTIDNKGTIKEVRNTQVTTDTIAPLDPLENDIWIDTFSNTVKVWENTPLDDWQEIATIRSWISYTNSDNKSDIYAINDLVSYNGAIYKNITGINLVTAPNLDVVNWLSISESDVVPLWKSDTDGGSYVTNDIINHEGVLYKNLTDTNLDTTPDLDTTNWVPIRGDVVPLWKSDTDGGIYVTNDIINYNGILYKNKTGTNLDDAPDIDTVNWESLKSIYTTTSLTTQFYSGATWTSAQSDEVVNIATVMLLSGGERVSQAVVTHTAHGYNIGEYYYLTAVAGVYTNIKPTTGISQKLFFVLDVDTLLIDIQPWEYVDKAFYSTAVKAIYHDGSTWQEAQADSRTTLCELVALGGTLNSLLIKQGKVRFPAVHGYGTGGEPLYLSETVAGGLTNVDPGGTAISQIIGYVEDDKTIVIDVQETSTFVQSEYGEAETPADITLVINADTIITSLTLPSAGTWDVTYSVRVRTYSVGSFADIHFTNSVGTVYENSRALTHYSEQIGATDANNQKTTTRTIQIQTTGSELIYLKGIAQGGNATVVSDAVGRSIVSWNKISGFVPISDTVASDSDVNVAPHLQQTTIAKGAVLRCFDGVNWESDTVEGFVAKDTEFSTPWGIAIWFASTPSELQFIFRNKTGASTYYSKTYSYHLFNGGTTASGTKSGLLANNADVWIWTDNTLDLTSEGDQEFMRIKFFVSADALSLGNYTEFEVTAVTDGAYASNYIRVKRLK